MRVEITGQSKFNFCSLYYLILKLINRSVAWTMFGNRGKNKHKFGQISPGFFREIGGIV